MSSGVSFMAVERERTSQPRARVARNHDSDAPHRSLRVDAILLPITTAQAVFLPPLAMKLLDPRLDLCVSRLYPPCTFELICLV